MAYTKPTISGYNSSPPSDDGANTATNEITWAGIKDKLADPIKNLVDAINTEVNDECANKSGDTFTGQVTISGGTPNWRFNETDAGTDQKYWYCRVGSEKFDFYISDDSFVNTKAWLEVERSGTGASIAVDSVSFPNSNVGIGTNSIEAWDANYNALQIGNRTALWGHTSTSYTGLSENAYYDGSYKYMDTAAAAIYEIDGTNGHVFKVAASGTADTAITWTTEVTINGGLVAGSPTGGAKGAGTINATAVYDDNVLLTCYVMDAALDGAINEAKWDAKVPDRVIKDQDGNESVESRSHDEMRKFKARLNTEYDPLDIDKYSQHWKDKRHLTSLPNEATFDPEEGMPTGSWIQRLVETVEIQAVHIDNLNQRLKALENA